MLDVHAAWLPCLHEIFASMLAFSRKDAINKHKCTESIYLVFFVARYKCPKCRAPFCCVQCSKDHKANQCPSTTDSKADAAIKTASDVSLNDQKSQYVPPSILKTADDVRKRKRTKHHHEVDSDEDEPGFDITSEMRKRLEQSTWLRKELQDGGLRYLIEMIDAASDDEDESSRRNQGKKSKGSKMSERITPRVLALARSKQSYPKFASFIDKMLLNAGVLQQGEGADEGHTILVPISRPTGEGLNNEGSMDDNSDDEDESDSNESSDSNENESSSQDGSNSSDDEEGEIC
jgi:hypothetical protein